MTKIDNLLSNFENNLQKHLKDKWQEDEVLYYLNQIHYKIDYKAINKNLREPAKDFVLRGGKRIRPLLFLTCIELFSHDPKKYLEYAVAIELIHNGTLVLDDIEDKAQLRRGKPTCHKKFGLDTATNVGASLHILPLNILLKAGRNLGNLQRRKMIQIYTEELTNVSFGQALDIYWHKQHPSEVDIDEYLEMVRLKTGSLMRMSTRLACTVTGRSNNTEKLFSDLAENLGIGFQIIDDCLDIDPPSEKFGKSFGNDITEGKLSLPIIRTLKNAPKKDAKRLAQILQKHTRDKKLIKEAINIVKENKGIEESRNFAQRIVLDTWEELEKKWSKRNNLGNLRSVALFLIKRDY